MVPAGRYASCGLLTLWLRIGCLEVLGLWSLLRSKLGLGLHPLLGLGWLRLARWLRPLLGLEWLRLSRRLRPLLRLGWLRRYQWLRRRLRPLLTWLGWLRLVVFSPTC